MREDRGKEEQVRKKELKTVVSFHTTTEALAMEEAGKNAGLDGRLIPVPRQIIAGCGLAWCETPEQRSRLEVLLREKKLKYDRIYELVI